MNASLNRISQFTQPGSDTDRIRMALDLIEQAKEILTLAAGDSKPYDRPDLRLASDRTVVGDLVIDHMAATVSVADKNVSLSKTEYLLLEFLAANRGAVMSQRQICSHLNMLYPDSKRAVKVYVGRLKSKLRAAGWSDNPGIANIRGFGYKLA